MSPSLEHSTSYTFWPSLFCATTTTRDSASVTSTSLTALRLYGGESVHCSCNWKKRQSTRSVTTSRIERFSHSNFTSLFKPEFRQKTKSSIEPYLTDGLIQWPTFPIPVRFQQQPLGPRIPSTSIASQVDGAPVAKEGSPRAQSSKVLCTFSLFLATFFFSTFSSATIASFSHPLHRHLQKPGRS